MESSTTGFVIYFLTVQQHKREPLASGVAASQKTPVGMFTSSPALAARLAGTAGLTQAGIAGLVEAGIAGLTQAGMSGLAQAGIAGLVEVGSG